MEIFGLEASSFDSIRLEYLSFYALEDSIVSEITYD